MEWEVKHVNSRGLSWSTDWHSVHPRSSIRQMSAYNQPRLLKGQSMSLYVCSSALQFFVARILQSITRKFVLVCGDCDEDFPQHCLSSSMFEYLLGNQNLIHIFAQNCRITHPQVTRMPIGLDYHTIRDVQSPIDQETVLMDIASRASPFKDRKPLIYTTFHFQMQYRSRQEAYANLDKSLVYYEPVKVQRGETWRRQAEYAFVSSPRGNGEDCHRTWEALALGCIPIVKSSPLDPLYDDLPVLIVKRWENVTKEKLEETIQLFSQKEFVLEKLTLKYWTDKVNICLARDSPLSSSSFETPESPQD